MIAESVFDKYGQNIADAEVQIAALRKRINGNSLLRLATIIGGGAALFVAVQSENIWLVFVLFFVVIVFFMGLVWRQSKLETSKVAWEDFLMVNQNEVTIAAGESNRYPHGQDFTDSRHPYSSDLDIFGSSSLFARINRCATPQANHLLADWLSGPADRLTIGERQHVIKELADDIEWCQQFQAKLVFNLPLHGDFKQQFTRFLENTKRGFGNDFLRLYVKAVPWLMAFVIGLAIFLPAFSALAVFLAVAHLLVAMGFGGRVNHISGQVDRAGQLLGAFARSFEQIEDRNWETPWSKALSGTLYSGRDIKPISAIFRELGRLIDRLDYRLNILVGAVLNMVALWDFRQVFAILDWRRQYGNEVLAAFDVVAEFEVLVSLATLSRNHPKWAFPEIVESTKPIVTVTNLSHPLISFNTAVANDYHMDSHYVALITGSNMAGKSTFLRTVGINAVLAYCGAPVCGEQMRLSVFRLVTYMRIADSLNESTSTFKAELNRIQLVLQAVKTQPDTFFLIDEMLRGTNSKDKYLGSKAIIKQLIADGGVGMVATHDLQLAKLADEYPHVLANFHFDIQVREGEMFFDYKLKPGECTIFNASLLLKNIGIDVME